MTTPPQYIYTAKLPKNSRRKHSLHSDNAYKDEKYTDTLIQEQYTQTCTNTQDTCMHAHT